MRAEILTVSLAVGLWFALPLRAAPAGADGKTQGDGDERPALWFPVGEELVYRIRWGVLAVGGSRITSEWIVLDGRRLIAIRYRTRTNALFNKIYPMNDSAEAIIDPETFLPLRFSFQKARWREVCDDTVTFDYDLGVARIESRCAGWIRDVAIDREVRDIISFMYWMRRNPIAPGMDTRYRVMANDGIVDVRLRAAARTERVDVPFFGEIECLRVEPELNLDGLLVENGKLTLWVAGDARRMAPLLSVKAPLARVRTTLRAVFGPGDDPWTEITRSMQSEEDRSLGDDGAAADGAREER